MKKQSKPENVPKEEGKEVTCPHCNYKWKTRFKLLYLACPSCMRRFKKPWA